MMKRFLWILSALLAVLAVYGSQEELNEKFFYLEEKPTEADGEVFFRGECKRNNYTPQKILVFTQQQNKIINFPFNLL